MKNRIIACLCIICILFASGCSVAPDAESESSSSISSSSPEQETIGSVCQSNDFEMLLFSDKQVYKTTDAIQIWATLEYKGGGPAVKIWHGKPYIVFSITDGKDFNAEGMVLTLLISTVLKKGKVYRFDYKKSGGYGEDDLDADFWKSFYAEKNLFLPVGEYTVSVSGAFSLTETVTDSHSGLLCELKIKVVE
ncbi:MAG: hypothetical protein FWF05_01785 [Oscillospiraceae bacterium]|nr:hypothetical protein [Oscillospiraceae bacterium]